MNQMRTISTILRFCNYSLLFRSESTFYRWERAMTTCSAPSMACCWCTRKLDSYVIFPMSTYSCKMLLTRRFTRQRLTSQRIASSGRKVGQGGPPQVVNLGYDSETLGGPIRKPVEVQERIIDTLIRVGFMITCPVLGLCMLDSNAVAAEVTPISPAALSTVDNVARLFSVVEDLDPGSARLLTTLAGPLINIFNVLFIFRIIMSWYPGIPVKKFPFFLAYNPTEPVLGPTRRLIPPVGGVDVAPVIWVAVMSFANEVLLGKQGLLVLLSQQQS